MTKAEFLKAQEKIITECFVHKIEECHIRITGLMVRALTEDGYDLEMFHSIRLHRLMPPEARIKMLKKWGLKR